MVLWTTDVTVNNTRRIMGFGNFSPDMQKAIRHIRRVFPARFAASDRSYAQPLESQHSVDNAADVASREQPFATYHYCTRESYAVIDTGCQRSAIGRNTLDNIASRLPAELPIKFVNQKFRFSGIGGETVTTRVALIPVCFGQRPGMVRAAVLEATPNAPFLLSLPILKALNTNLQLSEQSLQFHAINEVGSMFYNEKGQLCLRLFDFEAMSTCPNEASNCWQVRKIIGDECHVFMLQSSIESSTFGNHTEINQDYPESSQCQENHDQGIAKGSYETSHASCLDHDSFQPCAVSPVQFFQRIQSGSTGRSFESAGVNCESQLPRQASNFAETPVTSATPCGSSHGCQHQCPSQQEGLHVSCRDRATVCDHMASHVQQTTPARTSSDDSEVCRGIGHSIDELADASTGNGDASGRDGRDRHSPRYNESDNSRQEEAGEGSQVEQPLNDEPEQESTGTSQNQVQQPGKLFRSEYRDIGHHNVTPESGHGVSRLSSNSKQTMLQGNFKPDKCYCGMKPVKYTCRKQGLNYLRQFYRCPQEPNSQKQCHFFQWIRENKSEEYERLYATSPSNQKQPHTSKKFDKHYVEELSSCEEPEAISPSPIHRQVRGNTRDLRLLHLDLRSAIINGTNGAPMCTSR